MKKTWDNLASKQKSYDDVKPIKRKNKLPKLNGTIFHVLCTTKEAKNEFIRAIVFLKEVHIEDEQTYDSWMKEGQIRS